MATTWADVNRARQATPPASNVESLLDELATEGDLDAAIQLELLKLDARVGSGELRPCEGFAEALGAIARAVLDHTTGPDMLGEVRTAEWDDALRAKFLMYAWAYLVERGDREGFTGNAISILSSDDRVEVSGWFSHTAKGGWESVAPAWSASHADGDAGSGYMPPRDDDPDDDRAGRKAHLLANALLAYRYGSLGSAPAWVWSWTETSTTDNDVNAMGVELGRGLSDGTITPDGVAAWVKRRLCTEGRSVEGRITADLIDKLR